MRLRLLATIAVATVTTLAVSTPVQANHAWSNYHWARTANPFSLKLDNNVSATWAPYLTLASSDWSASTVLDTTVVNGSFGSASSCTPTTGHVEVCSGSYGSTGWLGIASISITTGNHISKAYVKVNDTYFSQAQYNTVSYRRLVMCQEVGHTFGLGHQDENQTNPNLGTCMDYSSNPAGPPNNEHPNAHDYAQLVTIYSHLDSFNTPTLAGPAASAQAGDSRASWGKLVHGSPSHGGGVYVRGLGQGNYTVTFVTWA